MKLTLTNVSSLIKKYGPFVVLFVLLFFIIFYSVKIGIFIYKAKKGPEVFYNTTFGVIKKPIIKASTNSAGLSFSIDTVEGKPTTATLAANIYFIPLPETKFGYRNRLFAMAENFGIQNPSSKYRLTEKNAEFNDELQKLEVNIANFNFTYKYYYEKDKNLFENTTTPLGKEAENEAIKFLNAVDKYPEEFKDAKIQTKYFYFDFDKKTLTQVKRNLDANIIEFGFIRPDLDNLSFVSSSYPDSHNFIKFVSTYDGYRIVEGQIKYFDRSGEHFGVYPVRTGEEAYKMLKKGKGAVLKHAKNNKKIIIKKMFLAYYDPDEYEEYFQPVYVFEGNNNFAAFIPAITEDYLSD
jgi:hypothetical protein